MSDKQPEALRIAAYLESCDLPESAAEQRLMDALRREVAEWMALSQDDGKAEREIEKLRQANKELLESLQDLVDRKTPFPEWCPAQEKQS